MVKSIFSNMELGLPDDVDVKTLSDDQRRLRLGFGSAH